MSKKKQTTLTGTTPLGTRSRTGEKPMLSVSELTEPVTTDGTQEIITTEQVEKGDQVTTAQLLDVILNMKEELSNKIDSSVGDLKKDVNQIKEQLDKYGDRFEETENRLSNVEDKIQNLEDVNIVVDKINSTLNTAIIKYDIDACKARKNNILINGLPGKSKDTKVAMQTFEKFCKEEMEFSDEWFKELDIRETYRFPSKKTTDPWPLFVSFNKMSQREEFYRAAPRLKGKKFSIHNDLAPCLIAERKRLIKESIRLKASPYNYDTKVRDTSLKVWLAIKRPNETEWDIWKGND